MNLHEYQSKKLFLDHGIPVLKGEIASSPDEAKSAAEKIQSGIWVVKAQVHAGGRGKAGGVKIAKSIAEVGERAAEMLGTNLITKQTDDLGLRVSKVYIESGTSIQSEYYLSLLVDRTKESWTFIASKEGGVDIEKVAKKNPEKITTIKLNLSKLIKNEEINKIVKPFNLPEKLNNKAFNIIRAIHKILIEKDVSLIEINPLVLTDNDELICLDAKINFDDNALYRHKDILLLKDPNEIDSIELEASKYDLSYIKLEGTIGCMVNGAGLAMATLDIIKLYGSEPANFLDVGGGASKEKVSAAFKIILSDKNVKGILINIFGGIMRCDVIAQGVVDAAKEINLSIPLVVRLAGTNAKLGKEILEKSNLKIISANNLSDAAKKIVKATK